MPGMGELFVILMIVLVVFGGSKLPGLGSALGKTIRNFKSAMKPGDDEDEPTIPEQHPKLAKREVRELAS